MTELNAIEELKCYRAKSGTEYPEEIEMAIAALEKQIPKKVSNGALIALSFPPYMRGDCPVCGSRYLSSADTNYCNACGQKLDFGEITEEEAARLLKTDN